MLGAAADLLDQGQLVNRLSLAVTAIAIGVLLLPVFPTSIAFVPTAAAVTVFGLIQLFLALRVALDAQLFRRLSEDAARDRLDIGACDAALQALRLMPAGKAGRPVAKRMTGAKRLFMFQILALMVQLVAAIGGAAAVFLNLA